MLRSHGCGELDRGLQNLDSLPAREGFFVILFVSNKKYVKVFKGFNWVCANLLFGCADSRFAEPRISFWEGFNFVSAKPLLRRAESRFAEPRNFSKGFNWVCAKFLFCGLIRGLQNLEAPFGKGFNFVRAKPPLRRAESRFGKPRNSRKGERIGTFCGVQKVPQKHAEGCDPLDSGDDSKLCRK